MLPLRIAIALAPALPLFLRRGRPKATREDAFAELFQTLSTLYAGAARLKPEWSVSWEERHAWELPAKYVFGNALVEAAARDMRYAIVLLQRNRWKSVVEPLFAEFDIDAWRQFQATASSMSATLIDVGARHDDLLLEDEMDWLRSAVEQLDDATRMRLAAERNGAPLHRVVAEGSYLPVYIAIQLSDRLIDRVRYEAGRIT